MGEQKRLTETDQKLWSRVFNVVCLSLFYLQSGHVEILQSRNQPSQTERDMAGCANITITALFSPTNYLTSHCSRRYLRLN